MILYSILAAGLLLVLLLLVLAARQPDNFRIERSTAIAAPPQAIFAEVNDLHRWQGWSPYVEFDPHMTTTYAGPNAGTGAEMAWSGNGKAGEGKMTIVETLPVQAVRIQLQFTKPFAATNMAEFTFQPTALAQTQVTWAMTGAKAFPLKLVSLFMNMDRMVGRDFERGLAKLKLLVETQI